MTENKSWYGFTEDKVFGWVMADRTFCKFVLQTVLPNLRISHVDFIEPQKELTNADRTSKDVRLDVLVTDDQKRIYDIDIQVANHHNLGKRMRFYQAKIDEHYTLQKGATYNDLRDSYVIFLCSFDFLGQNRLRYVFHEFEEQDRSLKLPTGATKVIINAKGSFNGEDKDLCDLAKLMQGQKISDNPHFDYPQAKIVELNSDPQRRAQIMDYETRLLEREQEAREAGLEAGRKAGIKVGIKLGKSTGIEENLEKTIRGYRKFGATDEQILRQLLSDYSQQFSQAQLKKLIEQVQ